MTDIEYSPGEMSLLTGIDGVGKDQVEGKGHILLLARALKDPLGLPWLLEKICSLGDALDDEGRRELRLALARVQIDADLRMNEDIQRYQQRKYVAQVIEILLYQELLLAPREMLEEEMG